MGVEVKWRQELAQREEKVWEELEKVRYEANHHLVENKALRRFAASFQDEAILPEYTPKIALMTEPHCDNCADLLHHLSQVKSVNHAMAMKIKDDRFFVTKRAEQIRQYQAWAEGMPEEKEVEAQELVKLLRKGDSGHARCQL